MKQITPISFFAVLGLLCMPFSALASVRVNEIAWMGTSVSSSNEWIELYNDGDAAVNLARFTLFAEGAKKLSIPLSGTIAPKSFFLLERTNDDTVPGILADQIYTGALDNGGEVLVLKDAYGTELQKINAGAGWLAGDKATKETMQWGGSSWGTATATPRVENQEKNIVGVAKKTATTSPSEQSAASTSQPSSQISAHLSPLPLSDFSDSREFFISAGRDRLAPTGGVLPFTAFARDSGGKKAQGISFAWAFGDGLSAAGQQVSHAYEFPGEYIVVLNASYAESAAVSRASARVFSPDIALSFRESENGTAVALLNRSPYEMNVSGWKLRAGNAAYSFPEDTIVAAKNEIVISSSIAKFQIKNSDETELVSPNGKIIARAAFSKEKSEESATSTALSFAPPQEKISTTTAPLVLAPTPAKKSAPYQYQYAAAVDLSKQSPPNGESKLSGQTIVVKKPEGFFSKLWRFFF